MEDFCFNCPDYDVCTIDPEEFEDECLYLRPKKGNPIHPSMIHSSGDNSE